MKPDCDETIRGEFRPVDSNVPGMLVCEHLPYMARQMDKVCVVRSVHHRMLCHNPIAVSELAATILDAFGVDPRQTYRDALGRPHVLAEGEPVTGLWGG